MSRPRPLNPCRFQTIALLLMLGLPRVTQAMTQNPPVPDERTKVLERGRFEVDSQGRAINGQVVSAEPTTDRTIIGILPDRTTGEDWGLPHLARAISDLDLLKPDAVFCVGDLVQGYTRDPATWDAEVDDYLSLVNRLDAEFWPTAGNHDVISGARDSDDQRFMDRYRSRFGPLHYAVTLEHGTVVVLFSDENLDGGKVDISDRQVSWLEQVLGAAPTDRPIVLLMHRPLWRYKDVRWDERVHPMLVENGVDAVIAGHFHALHRDDDQDGIEYHLLGVCGGAIDQHPLTGQFNHLTLLDLGPGDDIHIRHLPAGVMLPDDFIVREDQDRAYRLKSGGTARITGTLPDPWRGAVDATVSLEVRNPLDRPVRVTVEPATAPKPWLVEGHAFVARTEYDIANPATTDLNSPFELTPVESMLIEANASRSIPLRFVASATKTPPPPPEVRVTLQFEDSQNRMVPIVLPRRVSVNREDPDATDGFPNWPIAAWSHSVYEERETLGSMTTRSIDVDGRPRLEVELMLFDDLLVDDGASETATIKSRRNPAGDLFVLTIQTEAGRRTFLCEPPTEARSGGAEISTMLVEIDPKGGVIARSPQVARWRTSGPVASPTHRLRIVVPDLDPAAATGIQLETADNDLSYHTQWRSLAPRGDLLKLGGGAP